MASKSMKDAATAGASVVNKIIEGSATDAKDVKGAIDVKDVKRKKRAKYPSEERLSLAIPAYIKEYQQAAAYRESNAKHTVSITEYLCDLITADMEKHKDD